MKKSPTTFHFAASFLRARAVLVACVLAAGLLAACGAAQQPYHGFQDQSSLDAKDSYVLRESSYGGELDPNKLADADQRYNHHGIAYNQQEEGYYQWGQKMYALGYRDPYYIRDLAPRAMKHSIMDTYDHAIATGFEDAKTDHLR